LFLPEASIYDERHDLNCHSLFARNKDCILAAIIGACLNPTSDPDLSKLVDENVNNSRLTESPRISSLDGDGQITRWTDAALRSTSRTRHQHPVVSAVNVRS
jgi:hypothetical protein